ncbi:MAG: hypothetical protein QM790_16740 [Nibricoccus sp.]
MAMLNPPICWALFLSDDFHAFMEETKEEFSVPAEEWQWHVMRSFLKPTTTSQEKAEIQRELLGRFSCFISRIATRRWKQFRRVNGADGLNELVSVGKHAFITAVERWKPTHAKPIAHYASKWITYSCLNEALSMSCGGMVLPRHVYRLCVQYAALRAGQGLEDAEAFLRSAKIRDRTRRLVREQYSNYLRPPLSFDQSSTESEYPTDCTLGNIVPDEMLVSRSVEMSDIMNLVREFLLTHCRPRERFIFASLHPCTAFDHADFKDPGCAAAESVGPAIVYVQRPKMGYRMVGKKLGISSERVRQLYVDLTQKLRCHLQNRGIDEEILVAAASP